MTRCVPLQTNMFFLPWITMLLSLVRRLPEVRPSQRRPQDGIFTTATSSRIRGNESKEHRAKAKGLAKQQQGASCEDPQQKKHRVLTLTEVIGRNDFQPNTSSSANKSSDFVLNSEQNIARRNPSQKLFSHFSAETKNNTAFKWG